MKKNLWKILAALMVIALPLVVTSCKKDEDKGPKTYNYSWTLQNTTLPGTPTVAEEEAAIAAKKSINALFAAEFRKRGFLDADATSQTFSVTTEDDVADWDSKVKQACYTVKGLSELFAVAGALPSNASIVVKRSGAKDAIFNEKLR